jgi:hypothetical protein
MIRDAEVWRQKKYRRPVVTALVLINLAASAVNS